MAKKSYDFQNYSYQPVLTIGSNVDKILPLFSCIILVTLAMCSLLLLLSEWILFDLAEKNGTSPVYTEDARASKFARNLSYFGNVTSRNNEDENGTYFDNISTASYDGLLQNSSNETTNQIDTKILQMEENSPSTMITELSNIEPSTTNEYNEDVTMTTLTIPQEQINSTEDVTESVPYNNKDYSEEIDYRNSEKKNPNQQDDFLLKYLERTSTTESVTTMLDFSEVEKITTIYPVESVSTEQNTALPPDHKRQPILIIEKEYDETDQIKKSAVNISGMVNSSEEKKVPESTDEIRTTNNPIQIKEELNAPITASISGEKSSTIDSVVQEHMTTAIFENNITNSEEITTTEDTQPKFIMIRS